MNALYKNYIDQFGNFSHILKIELGDIISEEEKINILNEIFNLINEKDIVKNILDTNIIIRWRVYDETDLIHYYTDGNGILGDKAIHEHTKLLLSDIKKINKKIKITLIKPLTKTICLI
jgi:hypothetical protein